MRKFLIPLLMASAMMPAAANAEPGDRGDRSHGERSEQSDRDVNSSNDQSRQSQRAERSNDNAQRTQRVERPHGDLPRVHADRGNRGPRVERNVEVLPDQPVQVQRAEQQPVADRIRRVERRDGKPDGFLGGVLQAGREQTARQHGEVVVRRDNDNDTYRRWSHNDNRRWSHNDNRRWSSDWRRDHRYDWRSYRNRYSSLYRLNRYYDPYGWNYRRFSTGYNLWPSYYGSSFWLNDPWQYRLPPAYGPYRWVRYYDDALLVNIYTGQVADVIYNFFW